MDYEDRAELVLAAIKGFVFAVFVGCVLLLASM